MQKNDIGAVLILLAVLAFAVVIVDERMLRTAIAFVPALMLAQRSLQKKDRANEERVGAAAERRSDGGMRGSVDELLKHIREFYLTCHLMSSGKMTTDDAVEKAAQQELELNRLLALVTDDARGKY